MRHLVSLSLSLFAIGYALVVQDNPVLKATVNTGDITLEWTPPSSRDQRDWVAVYAKGAPNDNSYKTWLWANNTGSSNTDPLDVKLYTSITAKLPDGDYEFRYMDGTKSDPYVVLGTPFFFTVGSGGTSGGGGGGAEPSNEIYRICRGRVIHADDTITYLKTEATINIINPAESYQNRHIEILKPGDELVVEEWQEMVTVPERTADRTWRVLVNKVLTW